MSRNVAIVMTLASLFQVSVGFARPTHPPMIYCTKGGTHSQGPNTIYFDASDCGGMLPTDEYYGSISTLQVNGGNGGFQVFQPALKSRPGVWFYAMLDNNQFGVSVLYTRALH